jgi:hypothetical protein
MSVDLRQLDEEMETVYAVLLARQHRGLPPADAVTIAARPRLGT